MSGWRHTPGPWRIGDHRGNITRPIVGPDSRDICSILWLDHPLSQRPETKANALLISLAPEMVEALEACADWVDNECGRLSPDPAACEPKCLKNTRALLNRLKGDE